MGRAVCSRPGLPEGRGCVSPSYQRCLRSGQCLLRKRGSASCQCWGCSSRQAPARLPTPPKGPKAGGIGLYHPETPAGCLSFPEPVHCSWGCRAPTATYLRHISGVWPGLGTSHLPRESLLGLSPAACCPPRHCKLTQLLTPEVGANGSTGLRWQVPAHHQKGPEGRTGVGRRPGRGY